MSDTELEELYRTNEQIREYIDRFAMCRHIPLGKAFTHQIVKNYALWVLETSPPDSYGNSV